MSEALIVREDRAVVVTPEQMDLIKKTIAPDATDAELKLFIYDNTRRGVNPLDKMIHFTKRAGKYTPITSIDFMRTRAAETGEYAGSDDATFGGGTPPEWAKVTVYRFVQGQRCPFTATARWSEYFPGDSQGHMWRKMPHTMLAKCAEALALRKGFPQQISGLYTHEEMAQAHTEPEPPRVVRSPQRAPEPVPVVAESSEPPELFPEDTIEATVEPPEGFTTVKNVTEKHGEGAKGPWTLYIVSFANGKSGSSFDGMLATEARAAIVSKTPVLPTLVPSGKGNNSFNLTSLVRA